MKKYYIVINDIQSEPLTFDLLKSKKITQETLVWFEGLEDWKEAGKIEELNDLFKSTPPPIHMQFPPIPKSTLLDQEEEESSFFNIHKSKIVIGALCAALVIIFFSFTNKTQVDAATETKANTEQIKQQQIQIDQQNKKIAEQEQIELERKKQLQREELQRKRNELNFNLTQSNKAINEAKAHLNDISGFKIMRSTGERNRQINEANNRVDMWVNKITAINIELENTNQELNAIK